MSGIDDVKRITATIREKVKASVVPGKKAIDVAEEIERAIVEEGAKPAFPVNISIGNIAAHFTPSSDDEVVLPENEIIKVDFGIYKEGVVSDNALSFDFSGEATGMIDAAEHALEVALSTIRAGKTIKEVSSTIENAIKEKGFKPIANLTGHKIEGQVLHAGVSLPNVAVNDSYTFKEGDVFAVEPFVTTSKARGVVVDTDRVEIYSYLQDVKLRMRESRILLTHVKNTYGYLPFAERWLEGKVSSRLLLTASLKELLRTHAIQAYPVLREASGQQVAQAEKTVLVGKEGVDVLG